MKRYLVTGGSGYTGGCLAVELVKLGAEVHITSRGPLRPTHPLQSIDHTLHIVDESFHSVETVFRSGSFDTVFHLAADSGIDSSGDKLSGLISSNVTFGTQLLEAMVKSNCKHIVNTGSFWQHDSSQEYQSNSLYAATKTAFEAILDFYVRSKHISAVTLKLFDTFGPQDPRPKLIQILKKHAREGSILSMSPGEQKLSLVYIDDVISAMIKAAAVTHGMPTIHQRFFVYNEVLTLKEVVATFTAVNNSNLKVSWGALDYRPEQIMDPYFGETVPGWKAKYNLVEGLQKMKVDLEF